MSFLSQPPPQENDAGRKPRLTPSGPLQNGDGVGSRHQHLAVQSAPAFPGSCCIITSDPVASLLPEPSFPSVMLTDRSRRSSLFSLTQTMLGTTPEPSSLSRRAEPGWHCNTGGPGAGRSLAELLRRKPAALPAAAATAAEAASATEAPALFSQVCTYVATYVLKTCCFGRYPVQRALPAESRRNDRPTHFRPDKQRDLCVNVRLDCPSVAVGIKSIMCREL